MQTDDVISFIPFMSHRIFISHSSTDAVIAAQICSQLEGKGVTCWIAPRDVSLGNEYGKSIIDAIENAEGFVLVLSSHSNKSRAVLAELEKAFSAGLPLFPVRIQDVVPSKQIELFVRSAQWLDAFAPPLNFHINRLADMLQPRANRRVEVPRPAQPPLGRTYDHVPVNQVRLRWSLLAACVLVLTAGAYVLQHSNPRLPQDGMEVTAPQQAPIDPTSSKTAGIPSGNVIALQGGKLFFLTERLAPVEKAHLATEPDKPVLRTLNPADKPKDHGTQLELTFQLINRSAELVTLTSMRGAQLGVVTLQEDQAPLVMYERLAMEKKMRGIGRSDLGTIAFTPPDSSAANSVESGNLLSHDKLETLEPGSVRSFRVILQCNRHQGGDFLMEESFTRRELAGLSSLDAGEARLESVTHLFGIIVEIVSENGTRALLHSDQICYLEPEHAESNADSSLIVKVKELEWAERAPLVAWGTWNPRDCVRFLTASRIRTYRETKAYDVASKAGTIPAGFDADAVSEFCYKNDPSSPLRPVSEVKGGSPDYARRELESVRTKRTNLGEVFSNLRDSYPELWGIMRMELESQSRVDDAILRGKTEFLLNQLEQNKHP
jgi:hypothetical protein